MAGHGMERVKLQLNAPFTVRGRVVMETPKGWAAVCSQNPATCWNQQLAIPGAVDFMWRGFEWYNLRLVFQFILALIASGRVFFRSRHDTALEILALRQQVAVLKRKRPRPWLNQLDRLFWTTLSPALLTAPLSFSDRILGLALRAGWVWCCLQ